jgi:hypothetical protein
MKYPLIHPADAPEVPGLDIPRQFYWVQESPAPLAGMEDPFRREIPWDDLHALGFRWVVCLAGQRPGYDPAPLEFMVRVNLTDLAVRDLPFEPAEEEEGIRVIASMVLEKLEAGEGVIVHCAGGTGRTGTVLGAVLKRQGLPDADVLDFLKRINLLRGKSWPEAEWQWEVVQRVQAR